MTPALLRRLSQKPVVAISTFVMFCKVYPTQPKSIRSLCAFSYAERLSKGPDPRRISFENESIASVELPIGRLPYQDSSNISQVVAP